MKKQLAAGRRQRAAKRQRSEVGTQRTEDRFFCGSGFPRPELVEGQPRLLEVKLTAEG
jgi:hypothetical protein